MKRWFTSDLHFYHKNIISYTNRPEMSIDEHDEWLTDIWNSTVNPDDDVWHLGDFAFVRNGKTAWDVLSRLNGRKFFILGNHDNNSEFELKIRNRTDVGAVKNYEEIKIAGKKVVLCHYPIACWNRQHHGSWHLHGHSHGNYKIPEGKILDVGLDSAYNIYGKHCFFDEAMIEEYMNTRSLHAPDGHVVRARE